MKVKELSIENFKGIDSLSFQPKLLNVIVGRNNTGKSSVLEALAIATDPGSIARNYGDRPSSTINYTADSIRIHAAFNSQRGTRADIRVLRIGIREIIEKLSTAILNGIGDFQSEIKEDYRVISKRGKAGPKDLKLISEMDISELQEPVKDTIEEKLTDDILGSLSRESIKIQVGQNESFVFGDEFRRVRDRLTRSVLEKVLGEKEFSMDSIVRQYLTFYRYHTASLETFDSVEGQDRKGSTIFVKEPLQYLQRSIEKGSGNQELSLEIEEILRNEGILPNLLRFDFTELVFETSEGRKSVQFKRMGDGFQTLVAVLSLLLSIKDKDSIVLLEEPEVHMHPGYVGELVKYLIQVSSKLGVQIFITTHSYDLIESLILEKHPENLDSFFKDEVLLLRLTRSGETIVGESISYDDAVSDISNLQLDLRGI